MASLANQTISSTYDGLVKTSTDQPVPISGVQLLEDGVGNSLALSVGRANQGVTITGTATATAFAGPLTGNVTGNLTGTVLTAAQTNITSVGTLSSLAVSGNSTIANVKLLNLASYSVVGSNTDDASDNRSLFITGGGDASGARGAVVALQGNEAGGNLNIIAGRETGAFINFSTGAASTERMRIDSSGNVGIGSSSPVSKLTLEGAKNTNTLTLRSTTNDTNWASGDKFGSIEFYSNDNSGGAGAGVKGSIAYINDTGTSGATTAMTFSTAGTISGTNNAERMRIDSSGNVGIGTVPDADAELHIYKNGDAARVRIEREFNPQLDLESLNGYAQIGTLNNFPLAFQTNGAERMRIDASGNVGIGSSTPRSILEANGTISINDSQNALGVGNTLAGLDIYTSEFSYNPPSGRLSMPVNRILPVCEQADGDAFGMAFYTAAKDADSVERLRIDSSGNVGIGTSSPAENLEVSSSGETEIKITSTGTGDAVLSGDSNADERGSIRFSRFSDVKVFSGTSEALRIISSGNVGIGTSSPTQKLDVNGAIAINGTKMFSTIGTNSYIWNNTGGLNVVDDTGNNVQLTVKDSGNVGIGSSSPAGKVEVNVGSSAAYFTRTAGNVGTSSPAFGILTDAAGSRLYSWGDAMKFHTIAVGGSPLERMRIASNGNVLVGKTIDDDNTNGIRLTSQGAIAASRNDNLSLILNRTGTDGKVAIFRKDDTEVGSISVTATGASIRLGGNTTANELDDYEEGTWTPVYEPTTGTFATMTMDVLTAKYTKIGNMVTLFGYIRTDDVDITGGTGAVRLGGLPFTAGAGFGGGISIGTTGAFSTSPDAGYFVQNTTLIQLQKNNSASGMLVNDLTDGTLANQNIMMFSGTYFV